MLTNSPIQEQLVVNDITHAANKCFISATTRGLFGGLFCDFGQNFVVIDTNGENALQVMIANISHDKIGLVTCLEDRRHGLEDGDCVTFCEVEGMEELNACEPKTVKVIGTIICVCICACIFSTIYIDDIFYRYPRIKINTFYHFWVTPPPPFIASLLLYLCFFAYSLICSTT